ncbi:ATP-dependent RNA helicase RhlB [Pleionea mediterranea]|jgi:ATP-dependent RNA helicase RhlB|uniref:ATP-dependent RNA helicase RhlB n=1 Tax=Pleionea mediterranea TaxID=523701 RepID=A0A316FGB4_9GAMM|nr:ATP-dependent RNA helicase RhlB [Pleionea mediterranea]PWK46820.1 ATP-dependent RNA helicase RhlB [Pleionea mediterranea]
MAKHLTDTPFAHMGLDPRLVKALHAINFTHCTPIQKLSLPLSLKGQDVAGQAQTGTGKTIAFLLAALDELLTLPADPNRLQNEPRVLIMAPTRELVVQILEDAKHLVQFTDLKVGAVYGGTGYDEQRQMLTQGIDVLIGTTGRLIDYYKQGIYKLDAIDVVVLDEADRMFDLGFIADIRYLLRRMPAPTERLNMLFSATLSHRVQELAYEHMNSPEHVQVEPEQVTAKKVREVLYYPSNFDKLSLLLGLMNKHQPEKSMIFVNTKRDAETIYSMLRANDWKVGLLTGDVPQKKRMSLLEKFKSDELPALIATDVAARGLHIDNVSHVFNYDLPDDAEDYVHRIGRTARAGADGDAISFACEDSAFSLPAIEQYIEHSIPKQEISADLLAAVKPFRKTRPSRGRPNKRPPKGQQRKH